ncbi:unnamed protein product [Paramecium pentaurelia]|uniref:Transmembrane protein n=1 Tax=Paramecium pentaurelia TaxID=43138 RepID=A0A8S1VPQ4_9CILI|nr:unnamed protein product [Paramecium pentaurelia]
MIFLLCIIDKVITFHINKHANFVDKVRTALIIIKNSEISIFHIYLMYSINYISIFQQIIISIQRNHFLMKIDNSQLIKVNQQIQNIVLKFHVIRLHVSLKLEYLKEEYQMKNIYLLISDILIFYKIQITKIVLWIFSQGCNENPSSRFIRISINSTLFGIEFIFQKFYLTIYIGKNLEQILKNENDCIQKRLLNIIKENGMYLNMQL